MLDYILQHPWLGALVILIAQLAFMYLRTINVIYTSERDLRPTLISGIGLDISWLISMSIGLSSVMTGDWQPIVAFMLGATIGRYWGIKQEQKRHGDKKRN